MTRPKASHQELLRRELNAKGSIPEIRELREKILTVLPLMSSVENIIDFIEARKEYGLINFADPAIVLCVRNIERHCFAILENQMGYKKQVKPKPFVSNHEALVARAERERNAHIPKPYSVHRSTATRMAAGFDKRLDELIKEAQRSG